MGRRSGIPDHEHDLSNLTLDDLNAEIARVKLRLEHVPNTYLRKEFFRRLKWLEGHRETARGVVAPKRTMRARNA